MSKEKQIEEMARITCQMYCRQYEKRCAGVEECNYKCLHFQRCEALYNAGYRKHSEVEVLEEKIDDLERDTIPKLRWSLERANAMGVQLEADLAKAKTEVAREIFEEADKVFMANCLSLEAYTAWKNLKEKYTGGDE